MVSPEADAGESARGRITWRLLPFLFLLYIANYIDRTNIAYATLGMKGDLGLTRLDNDIPSTADDDGVPVFIDLRDKRDMVFEIDV